MKNKGKMFVHFFVCGFELINNVWLILRSKHAALEEEFREKHHPSAGALWCVCLCVLPGLRFVVMRIERHTASKQKPSPSHPQISVGLHTFGPDSIRLTLTPSCTLTCMFAIHTDVCLWASNMLRLLSLQRHSWISRISVFIVWRFRAERQ